MICVSHLRLSFEEICLLVLISFLSKMSSQTSNRLVYVTAIIPYIVFNASFWISSKAFSCVMAISSIIDILCRWRVPQNPKNKFQTFSWLFYILWICLPGQNQVFWAPLQEEGGADQAIGRPQEWVEHLEGGQGHRRRCFKALQDSCGPQVHRSRIHCHAPEAEGELEETLQGKFETET